MVTLLDPFCSGNKFAIMYILFLQQPEFLQKALNHVMCIDNRHLRNGKCQARSHDALQCSDW